MDRLKQMETFVAVAARGSLTAAALAEGVAPAIIGRRMDALEARLGVKLLLRTGTRFAPHCFVNASKCPATCDWHCRQRPSCVRA